MRPSSLRSLHLCGESNFILGESLNILRRPPRSNMNIAVGKVA